MRMIDLGLASVLFSSSVACSAEDSYDVHSNVQVIIQGGLSSLPEYDFQQISLHIQDIDEEYDSSSCSGFVVSPTQVLTAAHCADQYSLGKEALLEDRLLISVNLGNESIRATTEYVDQSQDFAYLRLAEKVSFDVKSISYASEFLDDEAVLCYSAFHLKEYELDGPFDREDGERYLRTSGGDQYYGEYDAQYCGDGDFEPGSSGSACFQEEHLVGVISARYDSSARSCFASISRSGEFPGRDLDPRVVQIQKEMSLRFIRK